MTNNKIFEPKVINSILSAEDFKKLQKQLLLKWLNEPNYIESFGKHHWDTTKELEYFHNKLLVVAKDHFQNNDILPSFSAVSVYEGKNAKLRKHRDDNACTYSIDLSVFQKTPWPIFVQHENKIKDYTLNENDALFMYGNDQFHWRNNFIEPDTNVVINAFFFFVEPDHWWYQKGSNYIKEMRKTKNDTKNIDDGNTL